MNSVDGCSHPWGVGLSGVYVHNELGSVSGERGEGRGCRTVSRRSIARWVMSTKSEKKVPETSVCGNYNLSTLGLPGGS